MPRHLTIVTGIFPPDIGGPASYVPLMASAFTERGFHVEVICWSDRLDHPDRQYGFQVRRIARSANKAARFFRTTWAIYRSARVSGKVFVNGLSVEATLAAIFAGASTIHKIVGDYAWEKSRNKGWFRGTLDEFQNARKSLPSKLFCWMRSWPIRNADMVIVPSRYLEGIVRGWGGKDGKLKVVYNSVEFPETADISMLPLFDGKTILTICRLVPWKGVDILLRVIGRLENVRLAVVGDGPLFEALKLQAHSEGLGERVIWLGHKPRLETLSILRGSDLFVLNSSYEGLPHVVLEAMYFGVPVVATNAGGTPEVVENGVTGRIVEFGDLDGLEAAIRASLSDPETTGRMSDRARLQVESRFAFEKMVTRTIELVETTGRKPESPNLGGSAVLDFHSSVKGGVQ